ncbi:uncharacterized protein LOC128548295 [Mercenaria mercenaria]|uniref:uncharacterized protein LOC128548295 n=1 Tax=Mercenaria mercenaria TaxID=6596 RepID=UPI00234E7866|nr:uncharacterized protein LOC128548295 [Mercenaria mercenaria]
MVRCIQTMQTKGIWILIFCVFASSVYVVLEMDVVIYPKPFPSFRLLGRKISVTEDGLKRNRTDDNSTSSTDGLNINKDVYFGETPHNVSDKQSQHNMASNTTENSNQNAFPLNFSVANNDSVQLNKSAIRVGILIPSSTKGIKNPLLEQFSLAKICIPSIYKTIEEEYTYIIYVGIDKGDYLETVKDELETMFDKVKAVVTRGRTFTRTINAIARVAYEDGMDYLVRINDDSSFETKNWTSIGISSLLHYSPPNVGVVGPTCHEGNRRILTHDMVHRTHLEIFDFYYPPYFDNWWADDWITKVYKPERSAKLSAWVVKHHLKTHGSRYDVDYKKEARLTKILTFDKERLNEYLLKLN